MNSRRLFRRSQLRLALWYAGVMGSILSLSGFGVYRAMLQSNWLAIEREIESIAGTLHDSVEPLLPVGEKPTEVLKQIFPDLCISDEPCIKETTLIQRHTIGISDRTTYYIRLFDRQGKLLAYSPNQPTTLPTRFNPEVWQTFRLKNGDRYHQFTTILHSTNLNPNRPDDSWGYLQIGRTLESFDAEVLRIRWVLISGCLLALILIAVSSWWLSQLAMQPIYESYQKQQEFTANAAHELRSPLASLLISIDALWRILPQPTEDLKTTVKTVERQGKRLSDIINELLFLSRLEQGSTLANFTVFSLNDLVNDLTEEFLELAVIANIHLTCEVPREQIEILGNESQLYRLVSNLLHNALKYTPKDGTIHITLKVEDDRALVSVCDTGIGISLEEQKRIFERFYRVDSDRSRKTGGTGLGLAIAKAIVDLHQGKIILNSELGSGSIFKVYLPLKN